LTIPSKEPITSLPFTKRVRSKLIITAQFLLGLVILVSIFLLSDFIIKYFELSFPPALLGIGMLLLVLLVLRRVPKVVAASTAPLLRHMVVFFIPAMVGIIGYFSLILAFPVALFCAIIGTTVLSLFITSWLSNKLLGGQSHD
jgi:holin-like protein